ncbi:TAP42 [Candida margitis]|uniref:TAP42 n=1 Tax=Candida margitis TaxID=1775924 RepID=UPI0022264C9E|nr:TAP42 [Candida margitis]KAI5970481.1 TAP42 [Candida margitis]
MSNTRELDQLTVSERFQLAREKYEDIANNSTVRQDSLDYQQRLHDLITEFELILQIVQSLSLFSDNERLSELTTSYIPYLNLWFYLSQLHSRLQLKQGTVSLEFKPDYLSSAKSYAIEFLTNLQNYGILDHDQSQRLNLIDKGEEIIMSPQLKRQEKIDNYKKEQQLHHQLAVLTDLKHDLNERFEDETLKAIYIDQLKFHILKAFDSIGLITVELEVLSNKPPPGSSTNSQDENGDKDGRLASATTTSGDDPAGFTTRIEQRPGKQISDLISKQGKILQPFTITSKSQLRNRVFGTGQVLPSMTVEEYLDYELANGKMMKEEVKDVSKGSDYESDEDDEAQLEKRQWDDWKDANPRGAGNMKANIG